MLKDFVKAIEPEEEELRKELKEAQAKLAGFQTQIKEAKLPVMVIFEGWGAAGKGSVIGRVIKSIDPRFFRVKTMKAPTEEELRYPFLHRYLLEIPEAGKFAFFDTYWMVQFRDNLYIIDQHAAHEKVMYERLTASLKTKEFTSQQLSPPIILTLSMQEEELLKKYMDIFQLVGFEIEPFGGREYSIRAVPDNLFGFTEKSLFIDMLDSLSDTTGKPSADFLNEKLATMACKSAVKGNNRLSVSEANTLIQELLSLENPYNCPHGRPTIISMSKYELEKKFKRIV